MQDEDRLWNAVLARDIVTDGSFVYAVHTTGVYCRPTCPSRRPLRANVSFFPATDEAERAGYRPCLRCLPEKPPLHVRQAGAIERACRMLEASEPAPALVTLAAEAHMSPFHFHRTFKAVTGLTPRAYSAALRAARIRSELRNADSVTDAVYAAGYGSSSRFYAESANVLGMKPVEFRNGGAQLNIRFAAGACSLGAVLVAATEKGICALLLGDDVNHLESDLRGLFPKAIFEHGSEDFRTWLDEVVRFLDAPRKGLQLPLDIQGTAFQQRVWKALQEIPCGETLRYSELAAKMGVPSATRAVARACAANALAVAVPCHRVVSKAGGLTGYRWGLERKKLLLEKEGSKA